MENWMSIEQLRMEYDRVKQCGDNIVEILQFKKLLLSENSLEVLELHYELIREHENSKLYQHLRAGLEKRANIEEFLLQKLNTEKDEKMQGDILHILGVIDSVHAIDIAYDFIKHENEYHKEVATYVLGWVGKKEDIDLLNYHMINEKSALLRKTAASAHRQLAYRMPEAKKEIIQSLKQGFENEKDDEVIPWIIIMIETILIKKLGIREDKEDPYTWHGNLEKAKEKTEKFLSTLDIEKV